MSIRVAINLILRANCIKTSIVDRNASAPGCVRDSARNARKLAIRMKTAIHLTLGRDMRRIPPVLYEHSVQDVPTRHEAQPA